MGYSIWADYIDYMMMGLTLKSDVGWTEKESERALKKFAWAEINTIVNGLRKR
jgi:hypothetical protein